MVGEITIPSLWVLLGAIIAAIPIGFGVELGKEVYHAIKRRYLQHKEKLSKGFIKIKDHLKEEVNYHKINVDYNNPRFFVDKPCSPTLFRTPLLQRGATETKAKKQTRTIKQ